MIGGEATERADDLVLPVEAVRAAVRAARAHHELQVVDDDVRDVVHVHRVGHCLQTGMSHPGEGPHLNKANSYVED